MTAIRRTFLVVAGAVLAAVEGYAVDEARLTTPIVDTAQTVCYGTDGAPMSAPAEGEALNGQDAQYRGRPPAYRDNGDGTVSDLVTGLMWTRDPGEKKTYEACVRGAGACRVGGHSDWRLPTIKELYSLIRFDGIDPDPQSKATDSLKPFIDTAYFKFRYGDAAAGDRVIDSQFATRTLYVSTTMDGNRTMFGVNFADGRIKGYPVGRTHGRPEKTYYVLYVRGNPCYGTNRFRDNGDGTVSDAATGLTWSRADSGDALDWPGALAYAEKLELGGHTDWRLPDAKELQSIVDYTRSPDTTGLAAIDPVFEATAITNEGGRKDFGCYWTSTSHVRAGGAVAAVYVAFGRALGWMADRRGGGGALRLMDVHGAGAQRSDPKVGDASRFPRGRGPQGDVVRTKNLVRCVRGGVAERVAYTPVPELRAPRREAGVGASDQGRPRFVDRLDRDGDGRVSRGEFDGPPRAFDMLDTNRDGYLSEDEAPHHQGHPPPDAFPRPMQRGGATETWRGPGR